MSPLQAVHNIPEICARHGITDVILSPGSRSAPLTLAFARHPAYRGRVRVVPDERAAAFIALGIAQATRRPVVLVCTSGTAGLNYAPAVAEAFFQQIPLLVLTADRPPEWIDQLDGQTIRQHNLYGAHAKGAFEFPVDTTHPDAKWHAGRIINEAINLAQAAPAGPVQVNIPLREPFYPKEEIVYEQDVQIIRDDNVCNALGSSEHLTTHMLAWPDDYAWLKNTSRILIVIGQHITDTDLSSALSRLIQDYGIPVIGDIISNQGDFTLDDYYIKCPVIRRQDVFLANSTVERVKELKPDLLITVGKSLISKSLKLFLRKHSIQNHWHIQSDLQPVSDAFSSLTQVFRCVPSWFLENLAENISLNQKVGIQKFGNNWLNLEQKSEEVITSFFADNENLNEFSAFRQVLTTLPGGTALHLANSMAVRYANILGIPQGRQIEVFANRGTSGIDGCNSTAVGAALAQPGRPVVLLTGDVAFFYDRNAFWHNYPVPNLRVVLFNNHGGGIFRLIEGPRQQPELEEFFETRQALTAENTARDFGLRYFPVSTFDELDAALPVFFAAEGGAAILEVFTDSKTNAAFFEQYRTAVKQAFS